MALAKLKTESFSSFASYGLSVVPMFLLMGQFAALGGLSAGLFRASERWLGHFRGGQAMAAIGACAGFGAICGSSLATAATMGQVALPELRRAGYSDGLATATLAAGGTLGVLIPPSIVLVLYAIMTEQNIARLFAAAIGPGILAALFYMGAIRLYLWRHPQDGPPLPRAGWGARMRALGRIWPVLAVFALVVGGISRGWFTPTEGAAIGAAATGGLAALLGGLDRAGLIRALVETATTTGMVFFIILGAGMFNGFLALTQVPQSLGQWVAGLSVPPMVILAVILLLYLALGCVMDSLSMILLTVPIFFPILQGLDFGMSPEQTALWFGVLVLIVVEVGLITPPVGMNLFVIGAMAPQTPVTSTYRVVIWFVLADVLRVGVLLFCPWLVWGLLP